MYVYTVLFCGYFLQKSRKKSKKVLDLGVKVRYNKGSLSKSRFGDLYKSEESEELFEVACEAAEIIFTTL